MTQETRERPRRTPRAKRDDLARVERKLDRLTRLVVGLTLFQPVLLAAALAPDDAAELIAALLLVVAAVLLIFSRLESQLPRLSLRVGRTVGHLRRWTRRRRPERSG